MALTDTDVHNAPTTGDYAYNSFIPTAGNFPALGGEFTDPVFGEVIRRLSDIGTSTSGWQHYSFHNINADGTLAFKVVGGLQIINTSDGSTAYANQPSGTNVVDIRWDMLDPDKYYYLSGTSLLRRNLAAQTNTTIRNFTTESSGTDLQTQGGSVNFQSRDGRYFIVKYSDNHHIWDSVEDAVYTGDIPPSTATGWVGITPDGAYAYGGGYTATTLGRKFYAYALNHATNTVNTTGIMCWDLCGDHGNAVSASDGNTYLVSFACNSQNPGIYVVTINEDRESMTEAQQQADAILYVPIDWDDQESMHFSAVSVGDNKNWIFVSTENNTDLFDGNQSSWFAYTQEIFAINVLTGVVRRLAHDDYDQQPRVTCSPTGNFVMWASNFNYDAAAVGYSDYYGIESPLGAASSTPGGRGSSLGGLG